MEYTTSRDAMIDSAREHSRVTYPVWAWIAVPLASLLIQVYLPLFETLRFVSRIDLPLLVTIYFSMMRRSQLRGLAIGAVLGLAQDSVFHQRLGMFGICNTLVGYVAASVGMQLDVEHPVIRLIFAFLLFMFHQFFYWVLERALLAQPAIFALTTELILGGINAILGIVLFHFLDPLQKRE